jgi:eukaryotic-like serine/threonine-protein kinase
MGRYKFSFDPGAVFPGTRYRVDRALGRGGLGRVYAATHLDTGERRAVKVLAGHLAGLPMAEARLVREAELLSILYGPHFPRVYEVDEFDDGRLFVAMDLLEGETLREALGPGRFSPAVACGLGLQVLAALAAVHDAGVVHRDVKPENLFWRASDGMCVLLDFGFAKVVADEDRFTPLGFETAKGSALGTARYLPPEAGGHDPEADANTYVADLYAAGVVLAELHAGRLPFAELGDGAWFARVVEHGFPMPPRVPDWVRPVLARATAKHPGDRYGSAAEFAAHLAWACQRAGIDIHGARPLPQSASAAPWAPAFAPLRFVRRPLAAGVVSSAAVALAASALVTWRPGAPVDERVVAEPRPVTSPATPSPPSAEASPAVEASSPVNAPAPAQPSPANAPTPAQPPSVSASARPPSAAASAGQVGRRALLEAKIERGQATPDEARELTRLCRRASDVACVERVRTFSNLREGR